MNNAQAYQGPYANTQAQQGQAYYGSQKQVSAGQILFTLGLVYGILGTIVGIIAIANVPEDIAQIDVAVGAERPTVLAFKLSPFNLSNTNRYFAVAYGSAWCILLSLACVAAELKNRFLLTLAPSLRFRFMRGCLQIMVGLLCMGVAGDFGLTISIIGYILGLGNLAKHFLFPDAITTAEYHDETYYAGMQQQKAARGMER